MRTKPVLTNMPRRQLGRHLREMRQGAGLSIEHTARLLGRGATTIQRLEKGEANVIRMSDIEALCEVCNAMEELPRLRRLADEAVSTDRGWWHQYRDVLAGDFASYLSLESRATKLTQYQPWVCPGLLQTPAYTRALFEMTVDPGKQLDDEILARAKRQQLITRKRAPIHLDVVIEEFVLRRPVGSRAVMAEQARRLADTPQNVELRVIPIGRPYSPVGHVGSFVMLDLVDEPAVVYIENFDADIFYDRARTIESYRRAHETLKRVALTPGDSKLLLRRIAREYTQ
ncbi:helix-turn-helix domain-containing protein [Nocardia cyriacigeorgica]|uniref:helix-turn-helix domain-containing protein n=1 Tax=Nocardia cyriacigeorgica TaxID=135487 RepID=UPI0018953764|nr:helix-turn-helix transcriptional regulator [Nocardia cyriacigeorgica]MBF6346096.1 helix-turn-helix domain-containing protein [Nocardia cyriacigeorgica]